MLGWQIFTHSVRLVWANRGVALRISAVLYVISAVFQVWLQPAGPADDVALSGGSGVLQLFVAALSVIISLWIAVAWHRYILLEEVPQGFLPQWHGDRMAAYFGRSILIGLILIGVMVVSAIPLIIGLVGVVGASVFALGTIFAMFVFYRLCAVLPATAMGKPITMKEAWIATDGTTGTIITLVICMFGGALLMIVPTALFASISPVLGIVCMLVAQWFFMMFGISIFTTFYGYFIEKRELS
jgi:hypothetical protein